MPLTALQFLQRIKGRTHMSDDAKITGEIISAQDWTLNRLWMTERGPDMLQTMGTEVTMAAQTREYDLGANVTGTLYGVRMLWLRFTSDTNFTPMIPADPSEPQFWQNDIYPASDTTSVAEGHPVRWASVDFAKVRFSPPLPADAVVRADFWLKPPNIDPAANDSLTYGNDIVEPLFECMVDKATAQVFTIMDDTRDMIWETRAERKINDALHVVGRRNLGPTRTQPFRARRSLAR